MTELLLPDKREEWYRLEVTEAIQQFHAHPQTGLSAEGVQRNRTRYGTNVLEEKRGRSLWQMILAQFGDFMIIVLLAAAMIAGFLGEVVDTIAILVIVLLNAVIGAVQEYRAERAMAALKAMAAPTAQVMRDGEQFTINASELVPGDLVLLEAGNIVSADMRLLEAADLEVNESLLTGESSGVSKHSAVITEVDLPVAEQLNMLFKGTQINRGRARGIVIATGMHTELGRIAALLQSEEAIRTPLQQRLTRFGQRLAMIVMAICLVVFIAGLLRGEGLLLMFLTAVSLAVAAIPEALPAVTSIALALGAHRMSHHNALVRHLPAVETLGSVTFICADKTGTLTENSMRAEAYYLGAAWVTTLPSEATALSLALALSNDVSVSAEGLQGDPTEIALYQAALAHGVNKHTAQQDYPRVAEIAFDSERKCMSTLHQHGQGIVMFTKGAPEAVLPLCNGIDAAQWLHQAEQYAGEGYRIIAVAQRQLDRLPAHTDAAQEQGLELLALVALIDPPRAEAAQAVEECRLAGITPVMITGDHPATALAIARRIGLAQAHHRVITGQELVTLTQEELQKLLREVRVFARVNPEQKIRIVEALQANGEFCAMTGDGINDAPALKRAEIGIAMGKKGTDVAREAADMVLLDDNFATITAAVREGRHIFDNIRKFIKFIMTGNSGEIWLLFLAPFLGLPIPLLPIHILWVNLVTDGLPSLALAVEPEEPGLMQRPPRAPDESIFAHGMWQHMVWVGLLIGGLSLFIQSWAYHHSGMHWQTMVFTVLTFSQLVHALAIRSEHQSLFRIGLFSNMPLLMAVAVTVVLQLLVIYVPFLQGVFNTEALSAAELVICLLLSSVVLLAVEAEKLLYRRGLIYAG